MTALDDLDRVRAAGILRNYGKAVTHMRSQLELGRFGLVMGTGVSSPLGFPDWEKLVQRIAELLGTDGETIFHQRASSPLPIVTQRLYQHFRTKQASEDGSATTSDGRSDPDVERLIAAEFREIIRKALYMGVPDDDEELFERDTFYRYFLQVIRRSPMTLNYNFDDSLERLLLHTRSEDQRSKSRTFETVTDARLQFRSREGIIYHPNGYLPRNFMEPSSETIVLLEGAFADQLISTMAGQYSYLPNHLSKTTCLLVGLSLQDETLRHLLRQNARISPGNFHYVVAHTGEGDDRDSVTHAAQAAANFEVFNLITLFLTSKEIGELGKLLSLDVGDFQRAAKAASARDSYCFYVTGVPGVGKTTIVSHFRSLTTYDEWLDERLAMMGRPFVGNSPDDEDRILAWVIRQWGLKTNRLRDDREKAGIALVDRCPPDAIAFTVPSRWTDKARAFRDGMAESTGTQGSFPGHVILILADPNEIEVRVASRGKKTTVEYTRWLQEAMKLVYPQGAYVTWIDTRGMSLQEVVRAVADVIHRHEYAEHDPDDIFDACIGGSMLRPETDPPSSGT